MQSGPARSLGRELRRCKPLSRRYTRTTAYGHEGQVYDEKGYSIDIAPVSLVDQSSGLQRHWFVYQFHILNKFWESKKQVVTFQQEIVIHPSNHAPDTKQMGHKAVAVSMSDCITLYYNEEARRNGAARGTKIYKMFKSQTRLLLAIKLSIPQFTCPHNRKRSQLPHKKVVYGLH